MVRRTTDERVFEVFAVVFIIFLCITVLYPFLSLLSLSFSTPEAADRFGLRLWPAQWSLESYAEAPTTSRFSFASSFLWPNRYWPP